MAKRPVFVAFFLLILAAVPVLLATFSSRSHTQKRRAINLPSHAAQAPFSDAILVGDTLYLAGRIGFDPRTGKPPEDVEKEIHLLLDGFKDALAEGGMTMDDLVYVTVYCPDLSLYEKFNAIYRTYFTKDFPARAFVGSGALLCGGHFEMQAIAVKR